jgi:flavin-dependent dehydrogenase
LKVLAMSALKPITIVGGGLAGLTLGIGLRQRAVPVTVWEAGRYPRHRVCGEFISGQGQATLAQLGLRELFVQVGARDAETAAFFSTKTASPARRLPSRALCLSRFLMDDLLAKQFRQIGGELRENERWRKSEWSEGAVRATGRRLHPVVDGWRWFGLKAHARKVRLTADLEMHVSHNGYVGICQLDDEEVNVCGLFRRHTAAPDSPQRWPEQLRGATGSQLHQRLADAEFEPDSFCSVAGLFLPPQRAATRTECCVGDELTMIPPVTGNGMSMAFESAEMAIEPLTAYSRGEIPWAEAQQTIARGCDEAFARRLVWATWLQRLMFTPGLQNALVFLAPRWAWLWRVMFAKTR